MVESVGHFVALCFFLQVVIADFRRHGQALLDVAILKRAEHLVVVVSPHSGEVVGLQFKTDAYLVRLLLRDAAHAVVCVGKRAEEILHVVAHLVGDNIGIGEVAVGSDSLLHLGEE